MEIKTKYLSYCNTPQLSKTNACVNFKSNNFENLNDNKNVKASYETIKKFLALPIEELTTSKLQEALKVQIKSINEYKQDKNQIKGFASLEYNTDCDGNFSKFTIHIPDNIGEDKLSKSQLLASLAHEYTHYLQLTSMQTNEKQFFDELKMAGLNIPEIMPDILKSAQEAFDGSLTTLCMCIINDMCTQNGLTKSSKTNTIFGNINVDNNKIAQAMYYDNEEDFVKNFKKDFTDFDEITKKTINNNQYLKQISKIYPEAIYNTIKQLLITFCYNNAKDEAEAYYTENKIFYTQGYEDRSSEIKYKYFNLLAKALE